MSEETTPKKRPTGLGRGLSALLGEIDAQPPVNIDPASTPSTRGDGVQMVNTGLLRPMPDQPRRNFHDEPIEELAASIKAHGVIQPILVREKNGDLQIVAGERRWRAAQMAQLHQVPVIQKEFDDRTALEIALVENIQREQLNAWEEGVTYIRLIREFDHSQEEVARLVGKSRSHVANLMRIAEHLPQRVHSMLVAGELSMGHARALLLCEDPLALARHVVDRRLSVRQTEALAKKFKPGAATPVQKAAKDPMRDADLVALERQLSDIVGVKVRIAHGGRGGTVTLAYSSLDQLDMICQRLSGEKI